MAQIKNKEDFLSFENLANLIETATYGNSGLSIGILSDEMIEGVEYPYFGNEKKALHLIKGGRIVVRDEYAYEDEDDDYDHFVTLQNISDALDKFIWESPNSFANLVTENGDMGDAYDFFQFVIFGEIVYG